MLIPRAFLTLLLLAPAAPAFAQFGGVGSQGFGQTTRMRPQESDQRRAAPLGLPGLAGRQPTAPIAPETDPASMSPNDALFDGISRGDANAVRDAVNRGADVNSRNALGLTALDAAVDQGRPEITFYLLSVRGTGSAAPPDRPATATRRVREPPPPREPRQTARPEAVAPAAQAAPRLPTLWAGNGGTPQPDIGFLGFDAGRPEGGAPAAVRAARRG
jgi:hypothetical protein